MCVCVCVCVCVNREQTSWTIWKYDIKTDVKDVNWIFVTQEREQW